MITREQQQAQFKKIYDGLNEQQKSAVDKTEGPVMVIAGPGTGKTQILGARIGKLRLETDTQPENILCLTYTDAGVVAMRKRLLNFIGPDAYKVNICTFHAFCNDVIQDNLSLFEKTAMDPISDLERIDLLKSLIDSFPKNHLLKRYRGDVYFEIKNLQHLFSNMKREGWQPEYINQCIDDYLNDLPNREEFIYKRNQGSFKKGDLKENKIADEKEKMEKLRAAVNEFTRFQQMMRSKNLYDFDDMINWVIDVFKTHPNVLARYQEQYQYILVDEFQDTSGTQNMLIKLLISYWDEPNVFVVGDDDQSIYRFQGANVENMQQFADQFSDSLYTVVLTNNYRSTQPILDVSRSLIERNKERLVNKIEGLSKILTASNTKINEGTIPPTIREYENPREEMIHLTLQVEELIQSGVEPRHICIIYRENKPNEELAKFFQQKQIPVYSKRDVNILHEQICRQLLQLLRYLKDEHHIPFSGDELLFEILHYQWFGIPPIEVAKLSAEAAQKNLSNQKISLRQLIAEKLQGPLPDLFSTEIPGLRKAQTILEKLIGDVPNVTVQQLFENCIRETGLLAYVMNSPDKHWLLQLLTGLFDFIKKETHRNPNLTLEKLVNIFDLMEKESLVLPLVRVSGTDSAVNLLTAHGSKGLEYEYVFIAGCNSANWEKKRKPSGGYSMPDTIFASQPAHSEEEELRRLFYVAMTRASQHLYISYTRTNRDGKEIEPSMFIAEIREEHALPYEKISLPEETIADFAILAMSKELKPEIEHTEAAFIDQLLDKFVMNVTALNNYLKCPLQFYFNNLVRVPSGKSEATEFGSAVHHALQKLFQKMQQNHNQFPDQSEFLADFKWYMERNKEHFTKEQFARRIEQGEQVLPAYYERYIHEWEKIVAIETNIRNVILNGIPLKGKLDKLEFTGRQVNVVDYKTGDAEKGIKKLTPPSDKDPNGGDYWRQAVFYKILVDHYPSKNWEAVSAEFDFIEPDKKKGYLKEKRVITPQDIATVKAQIEMVWEKIKKRDFYTGCGKEDCRWCEFVKTNEMAVALHETDENEEETE
ncbi:ATP-dependent DNA helicase [Sediminibacterium sp. KACHI17]|uniref:DNA 3'-5' helicase n=1 Tax=Sediminibacterium sp. KACHI17 TaxID=1751071 RepID=A0AAT9GJN1_9BACT